MTTQERIIEHSAKLFFRYGIKSITMDDIAKDLGISKKTIYQHFTDKDEVVFQVFSKELEKDKCSYLSLQSTEGNIIDKMVQAIEMFKKTSSEMHPSLIHDLRKYHPRAWALHTEYKHDFIFEAFKKDLQQGVEEGLFRADIHIDILARFHLGSMEISFDHQLFPPGMYNIFTVQLILIDHFIRGILSEKGLSIYLAYKDKFNHNL